MEGREWVSLGGVGHVELSEGFFRVNRVAKNSFEGVGFEDEGTCEGM